jgi:hypothetical protein
MDRRTLPNLARIACAGLLATGGFAGCGAASGCDLVIAGLPDGVMLEPGSTLPPGSEHLATTADLDVVPEPPDSETAGAATAFAFRLRPEAASRMAAYSAAHVGQSIAITVDGIVATAPVINSPLSDEVVVALAGETTFETAARLEECVER